MSVTYLEAKRSDPGISEVLQATFPDYRGRKIKVRAAQRPLDVTSFWDGGSRSYFKALDLSDLRRVLAVPQNGTPYDGGPIRPNGLDIPVGFAIVERAYFCGREAGITIHVHPDTIGRFVPEPPDTPALKRPSTVTLVPWRGTLATDEELAAEVEALTPEERARWDALPKADAE